MQIGDIVYFPFRGNYVKYRIKCIDGDELLVLTYKTHEMNWLTIKDILNENQFKEIYKGEIIYE